METNGIILNNVTKKYKGTTALKAVNLKIENGLFGLLGRNGAGKTTLMQMITTLIEPTEGTITVNGIDVVKDKIAVRSIVGFLPQDFNIYPRLTAYEFMDYIAKLNKIKNRKSVIDELLEKVNLTDVKDKRVGGFSGGMKRRLGIAQALVKDPKILIVDEPTAGLDPEERIRFRTMLVELSQKKVVLLSTHIVEDISASCENIGILDKGIIKYVGNPTDFIKEADNKVWEVMVRNKEELIDIKNKYSIIAIKQTNTGIKARVVKDNFSGSYEAKKAEPNLEDAYIYFFEKQVG